MKYEYWIQKHDISPQSLEKFKNDYDEDDSTLKAQIESMGALGWELCGVIRHPSDANNAKFIYKREIENPEESKAKSNLDFGQALIALREGHKVCREGWNSKDMFLALAYPDRPGKEVNAAVMFNRTFTDTETSLDNFIVMKTVQNTLVPWLANQTDILAHDWAVLC